MTEENTTGGEKRVKSVERSFELIELLQDGGTMRIRDVSEELGLPMSTAHVHLKTLESVGYAVKNREGYRLGLRFLRTGCTIRERMNIYAVAKSEVDDLARETEQVANIGVEENGWRVILCQSEGKKAVYDNAPIGEYAHMHLTALGKAILARLPQESVENIIGRHGLPTSTENTIGDLSKLYEELTTTREQGFALEDEERRVGIRSIAVPVIVEEAVVGAISLTGTRERFDDSHIENELLPALRRRRNTIEVRCAYD